MRKVIMVESKSIHIGILVAGFPPEVVAGAELQAQRTAEELARRGHRVTVFTRSEGTYSSPVDRNGYSVHPRSVLPVKAARTMWDIVSALRDIASYQPRPDVVLCYEYFVSGLIGVLAQKLLGIPAVVSVRGSLEYRLKGGLKKGVIAPFVFGAARCVAVQTPRIADEMYTHFRQAGRNDLSEAVQAKTSVVPNGIDLPLPERADGSKVLYVGRLVGRKGIADLIMAVREVPSAELVIVGDGPARTRLEALAAGSPVVFEGRVPHAAIADYLRQARVLVLPSHRGDGLPNVIMEAMSLGVPAIATETAGIPDLVRHGETGYLYEPGDIRQLSIYINQLLSDDELHRKFGESSLQAIQSYSWDTVAPKVERMLLECAR
ncbi:MAG: glycosyltransferase family 4 protein [Anaerolineae bacterium]